MDKHRIHPHLMSGRKAIQVLLVGAGGTGSRVLEQLACLHRAMLAKGHAHGLDVTVVDDDVVSAANVGRQAFYGCDIGHPKASVLVNRINMALGGLAVWRDVYERLDTKSNLSRFDLVIGAVDNRRARLAILRGLEKAGGSRYWLDFGNASDRGQVVLGEVNKSTRKTDSKNRLPHVAELFPDVVDPSKDGHDDQPSCSLAEALEKQSLFINPAVATMGMSILWNLFTKGEIQTHGAFVDLKTTTVLPLEVDHEVWARMGVVRDGVRRKVLSKAA